MTTLTVCTWNQKCEEYWENLDQDVVIIWESPHTCLDVRWTQISLKVNVTVLEEAPNDAWITVIRFNALGQPRKKGYHRTQGKVELKKVVCCQIFSGCTTWHSASQRWLQMTAATGENGSCLCHITTLEDH